ncbi:pilin [Candidatus Parcubacteria bacterium]|nr:pilin [Candidatus Parcubacteria bacterium]
MMQKQMKKYLFGILICFSLLSFVSVHADSGSDSNVGAKLENPFKGAGNTLTDLFTAIINKIIIPIGSVLAVVAFIWAGFLFVTAGGDEGQIKTAKAALLYAAIGTAVLLGAAAITTVLQNTINSLK